MYVELSLVAGLTWRGGTLACVMKAAMKIRPSIPPGLPAAVRSTLLRPLAAAPTGQPP